MKHDEVFPDFTKGKGEVEPAAWAQVLIAVLMALSAAIILLVLMNPVAYHDFLSLLK